MLKMNKAKEDSQDSVWLMKTKGAYNFSSTIKQPKEIVQIWKF